MTATSALRMYVASVTAITACSACHPAPPEARFGLELGECIDLASTRQEADACRERVEAKHAQDPGYVARDGGGRP